jgi:hypothetical protein
MSGTETPAPFVPSAPRYILDNSRPPTALPCWCAIATAARPSSASPVQGKPQAPNFKPALADSFKSRRPKEGGQDASAMG